MWQASLLKPLTGAALSRTEVTAPDLAGLRKRTSTIADAAVSSPQTLTARHVLCTSAGVGVDAIAADGDVTYIAMRSDRAFTVDGVTADHKFAVYALQPTHAARLLHKDLEALPWNIVQHDGALLVAVNAIAARFAGQDVPDFERIVLVLSP